MSARASFFLASRRSRLLVSTVSSCPLGANILIQLLPFISIGGLRLLITGVLSAITRTEKSVEIAGSSPILSFFFGVYCRKSASCGSHPSWSDLRIQTGRQNVMDHFIVWKWHGCGKMTNLLHSSFTLLVEYSMRYSRFFERPDLNYGRLKKIN